MDLKLVEKYRLVYDDILLLYDTFIIHRSLLKKKCGIKFVDGLRLIVAAETKYARNDMILYTQDDETIIELVFNFMYSILFEFFIEELSQFPFWLAKVHIVTINIENPLKNWLQACFSITSSGNIFYTQKACVSYLALHFVQCGPRLQKSFFLFLDALFPLIPKSTSRSSNSSSSHEYLSTTTANTNNNHKQSRSIPNLPYFSYSTDSILPPSHLPINGFSSNTTTSTSTTNGNSQEEKAILLERDLNQEHRRKWIVWLTRTLTRVLGVVIVHPLLNIAVTLATATSSTTTVENTSPAILISLLPVPLYFLGGVPETLIFREITRSARENSSCPPVEDNNSSSSYPTLVNGSIVLTSIYRFTSSTYGYFQELLRECQELSWKGMTVYGYLTLIQIVPGFLTYTFCRSLVVAVLGNTKTRKATKRRRHQLLTDFWLSSNESNSTTTTRTTTTTSPSK